MTTINASPHVGQAEVHQHGARFKVLDCGRRWGKTRLGVMECLDVAANGGRAWWVAPTYRMSEVGWRPLRRMVSMVPGGKVKRADRQVSFPGGGEVSIRSADNPDTLRGEGLDFAVMDECAFMRVEAWTDAIRPALADRLGSALFISTPKGRNWFWRLWQRGQTGLDDWHSWRFTSYDNPYILDSEIDAARETLPERVFQQEFLAEFIDDAGGVFRNVMACATATHQDAAQDGSEYIVGIDWGKQNDFTVAVVIDTTTNSMVHMDRFNQIDYTVQVGRLRALCERFQPFSIIAERNSMGEPLIEQLQREGLPVSPFTTSNASKAQIIDGLALAFERQEISILNDQVLIGELQAYEMERLPSGLMRYNAPAGMHDDCVMALAMANQPPVFYA